MYFDDRLPLNNLSPQPGPIEGGYQYEVNIQAAQGTVCRPQYAKQTNKHDVTPQGSRYLNNRLLTIFYI